MGDAKTRDDVAPFFGPLSAAEVRYLMKHEWARTAEDVLWRRSKLGLKLAAVEKEALGQFMAGAASPSSPKG
jgi:glycerol-3-phosphate dehydrogenase